MKATAVCTWGDGPDILMSLEGIKGPDRLYDLSLEDAEALVNDLTIAIRMTKDLELSCEDHLYDDEYNERHCGM